MPAAETFQLPEIVPDFSVMGRDALEAYAADCDYLARSLTQNVRICEIDYDLFFRKLSAVEPDQPHLTQMETRVLARLGTVPITRWDLYDYLYPCLEKTPDAKIIDVWISRLRRKLAGLDLHILTILHQGYAFTDRSRLDALIGTWRETGALPAIDQQAASRARIYGNRRSTLPLTAALRKRIIQLRRKGVGPVEISLKTGATGNQIQRAIRWARQDGIHIPEIGAVVPRAIAG